jgi:Methylase involved in ubiquinone/menaquinone biosynthesis
MIRALAKRLLPPTVRRTIRTIARELPTRVRDLPSDLGDLRNPTPLPPAYLRSRVARTSSRGEFLHVGERLARSITEALRAENVAFDRLRHVLDFGCGSGRVARHMMAALPQASFVGVDVDRDAITWCRSHLPGSYHVGPILPPTLLRAGEFDLVYAVSVFTHLDEELQDAWLGELRRLLRPGGFLVVSTHSPVLTFERPDLTSAQHRSLQTRGFLFAGSGGRFNDESAFHSPAYLQAHWSRWFEPLSYTQHGMAGYQDLSVFRKEA